MNKGVPRAISIRRTTTLIVLWAVTSSSRSADSVAPKTNSPSTIEWTALIRTNFPILSRSGDVTSVMLSTNTASTSDSFSLTPFSLQPIIGAPDRLQISTNLTTSLLDSFSAETAGPNEASLNLYREQHEAINGVPLLTVSPRTIQSEHSSRFEKVLNRFLPANGAVFGRNPNARHDPLLMGNDW